jgi:hypothetical protein
MNDTVRRAPVVASAGGASGGGGSAQTSNTTPASVDAAPPALHELNQVRWLCRASNVRASNVWQGVALLQPLHSTQLANLPSRNVYVAQTNIHQQPCVCSHYSSLCGRMSVVVSSK